MTGPGADAFATLPFVDGQEGAPFVPAAPEPPKVTTPEEAKLIGVAVANYWEFGTMMLLAKRQQVLRELSQVVDVGKVLQQMPVAKGFVAACAERCVLKYNIRVPYVDEGVTLGAIGMATAGLVMKPVNDNGEAAPRRQAPAAAAPSSASSRPRERARTVEEDTSDVFTAPRDTRDVFTTPDEDDGRPGIDRMPRDGEEDLDPAEAPQPDSERWVL